MINKDLLADLDDLDDDSMQAQQNPSQQSNPNHQLKLQQYGITTTISQKHSRLLTSQREQFIPFMQKINIKIDKKLQMIETQMKNQMHVQKFEQQIITKQSREQINQQISKCNIYAAQISRQMVAITKFVKQIYGKKLPQLQGIVQNDGFYCKALLEIENGNKGQNNQGEQKQMFSYLSSHQRISLRISISAPRDPLSKEETQQATEAAKVVLQLKNHHEVLMMYLETCIQAVAPNLCQLLGSTIASKLVATAGGVDKLAATPACNIQVMGGSRSSQIGLSQLERNHTGVFGQMEMVQNAPKKFQMKLVRMLATNTAKCARADFLGSNNGQGNKLREDMYQRFQKVQEEGGLMRTEKPLDIPDMQPKKKRGGKRHRKNKQLYEMSELRKNQNRLKFGEEAEQQIEEGVGLGMLKSGTGKLKVQIKKQNLKVSKKMQERATKKSGLQSTLNLSGVQGIQLINPSLRDEKNRKPGSESYFAKESGFRTILNNKLK